MNDATWTACRGKRVISDALTDLVEVGTLAERDYTLQIPDGCCIDYLPAAI